MRTYLHLWIGNPESASEMTELNAMLLSEVPERSNHGVVYERKLLDVSDLADGFTSDSDVVDAIQTAATRLGIEKAYAMFGWQDQIKDHPTPDERLRYLGSFEVTEEGE